MKLVSGDAALAEFRRDLTGRLGLDLLARWREGDEQAAAQLVDRFTERLLALARCHLSQKLARRVDAEDVVQSAYRSFFTGARTNRYQLQRSGDLWQLLAAITLHKLQHQLARHTADKTGAAARRKPQPRQQPPAPADRVDGPDAHSAGGRGTGR